jgi:hypothetical protein
VWTFRPGARSNGHNPCKLGLEPPWTGATHLAWIPDRGTYSMPLFPKGEKHRCSLKSKGRVEPMLGGEI